MQDFYAYIPAAAQNKLEAVLAQHPIEIKASTPENQNMEILENLQGRCKSH